MNSTPVLACEVVAGQVMYWHGEWWQVKQNYCHPKSCYAKMSLVNDDFAKEHGRNSTMYTSKSIGKRDTVMVYTEEYMELRKAETTQVSLCSAIDLIAKLKTEIEQYSSSNDLPETVDIVQGGFSMDSAVVKRLCHEKMMATFSRLKNVLQAIDKP